MRLDIAEGLTKPLGHLCVERAIKPTAYVNAAVRAALVLDGEIAPDGWRRGRPVTPVDRVPVIMADGTEGFASCDEDGWHLEGSISDNAGKVVGWGAKVPDWRPADPTDGEPR